MNSAKILIVAFLVFSISSFAQVTSTFNTNAEGWILRNNDKNITATITHHVTGGNPGGYISGEVALDIYPGFFWQAPAKFRGDLTYRSFEQTLTFSLQQAVEGDNGEYNGNYIEAQSPDIIISNGSQTIYFHISTKPAVAPSWSAYSITLSTASAWRTGSSMASGLATNEQIKAVLTNVTSLYIRANFNLSANTLRLSNIALGQRSVLDPPVVSGISTTSGQPGSLLTISGNNFAPNPSDNLVFFGSVLASISNASATQLVVTVPPGAPHDYIHVLNKVTGLTSSSTKPFVPTFEDGGRIIAASFTSKIEIPTSPNEMISMKIADIDGDGWNDLLISENTVTISIFRNKGTGNNLTADSFESKVTLTGGGNQTGLFVADADGDGKPDIITGFSNGFQKSFATFRNTSSPGNVSFEPVELWPGLVYSGVTSDVIDLDGDGLVDLIGQHQNSSAAPDFWVAQNISTPGNIEFGAAVGFFGSAAVDAGVNVTTGDLNGDGKPDLVIKYGFGGSFAIAENTSTPGVISFGSPISFSRSSYGRLVIGDFNNDGKNDIALKHGFFNDDIIILINSDTDGTLTTSDFSTQVILDSELFAGGNLSIADINGDGRVDLIVTDGTYFGVFENVYTGGAFNANAFVPAYLVGTEGASLSGVPPEVADLNGDGRPEIILYVASNNPRTFAVYENINAQAPVISLNTITPLSGPVGSSVTITGSNFSIVPAENSVMFGAVRGTVSGATETSLTVTVPAGASPARISVTRDRLTSIYHLPFTPTFSGGVSFDDTHFAPPVSFPVSSVQYDPEVADLNNDGKPDIIVNGSGNGLTFRNTHTSGSISATSLTAGATANSASPPRLMDLDGDGKIDLVGGSNVFRNISSGDPIDYSTSVYISPGGFFFNDFADFNRDGRMDFIGVNGSVIALIENRTTVGAFLGLTRASSFSNYIQFSKPAAGGSVVTSDFDNDGETDIAATNPGTDNVSVWRNNGAYRITTTQFTALPTIAVGDNPSRIYTGDFDRDGKIDLLIIHSTGATTSQITLLQNQSTPGNISFSTPINLTNPSALTVAHVADLDGDGKPEIITTSESGNRFSIFKNIHTTGPLTAASFAAPFNTTVTAPRGVTTGDLNLDGKPEIILTRATGLLVVYENLVPTVSISVTTQPTPSAVCDGITISFTTAATGTTNISYQWQFSTTLAGTYTDINNGGGYTNANTASLSVNTTGNFGAGFYRCRISGDLAAPVFSNAVELTINAIPAAPTVTNGARCGAGSITLAASGGVDGQYRWYTTATGGIAIAAAVNNNYVTPSLTTTTPYFVSINNGACESNRIPVDAIINVSPPKPIITASITPATGIVTVCDAAPLVLSAPTGFASYAWSSGETTDQINITLAGSYTVIVTNASGCASESSDPITVITDTTPPSPTVTAASSCGSGTVTLVASGGTNGNYRWYDVATGGTALPGEVNNSFATPALSASATYYVSTTNGNCESNRVAVTATVNVVPAKPVVTTSLSAIGNAITFCSTSTLTLTAPAGFTNYSWSDGSTSQQITVTTSGAYSVIVSDVSTCPSPASDAITVTVVPAPCNNSAPVINNTTLSTTIGNTVSIDLSTLISDADNNLVLSSLIIVQQPTSGAQASLNGTTLQINYSGNSFTGIDVITIRVCDVFGECTTQQLQINVIGEIEIYNGISPNEDQLNPIFLIRYIDLLPETQNNKVTIYNRWGSKVFEVEDYNNTTNVFRGVNDNGNELPSGTYFYKIQFNSSRKAEAGYLTLKR